jgi:hypothetical protein
MRARWQLLLLVAALVTFVGLAQTQQGHSVLRDVGLYQTPATYTELAFSSPGNLPETLSKPNSDIDVSFSIHNVSSNLRSYQWSIVIVHAGKSQVKASGTLVSPGQSHAKVTRSVAAACAGGRLQVTVHLASPAESISFWVTCPPAASNVQGKK